MTKRVLGILLAAVMSFSLTACSSGKQEAPDAPQEKEETAKEEGTEAADEGTKAETDWPAGGIQIIVPLKAGGDTDFYARTYAQYLEKELGQTVTIVNVEGSGGTVGAEQVAAETPDGNTILFYHTGNMFTNKLLGISDLDNRSFDVAAVGVLDDTNVLVAGKDSGFTDGKDFLEKAQANPGKYNVAVTISGFSYFVYCKAANIGGFSLNPVDVSSASDMVPSILGGQTELAMNSYGVFGQYIENGDVIPLMTFSEERNPRYPDVPTASELGLENCVASRAYFFAFPKGTDPAIVEKLSQAVENIQSNEEYVNAIGEAYMVNPFFVKCGEAQEYLDGIWDDMSQYEAQLNGE